MNDVRFAFRQFTKAPGFTAIIVLTLALSIGACTAIYSALDRMVLNPFDDPATKRNVVLRSTKLSEPFDGGVSFPDFLDLEKEAACFEFLSHHYGTEVNVTGSDEPLRLRRHLITPRYLEMLGIEIALGRGFRRNEFIAGHDNVVLLGHTCWQRNFGGAHDVIGRTLQIEGKSHTVVGVFSERHERTGNFYELWVPLTEDTAIGSSSRDPRGMRSGARHTLARLRPGVSMQQAQSEVDVLTAALAQRYPETNKGFGIKLDRGLPGQRIIVSAVQILFAAVSGLMLIACANVASLLLIRANARQREMSVRAALGASRGRLIRQLLVESIIVGLIGGAAGVLLAQWAVDFIRSSIPTGGMNIVAAGGGLARLGTLELDGSVLLFALGLSITTALIFGLAPAWLSSSADLNEGLKQGTRGSTEGRSRARFRAALVVGEIAMAVTLLACSGLLLRSFAKLAEYNPGFDPKGTAFVRLSLGGPSYATLEQQSAFNRALLAKLQSATGVEAAGTINFIPLSGRYGPSGGFEIEGRPVTAVAERPIASWLVASADYFRTMRIPLKQGRVFSDRDDVQAAPLAIINQTLARQQFPGQDPIGKRIRMGSGTWREIVGVVGDVAQVNVDEVQPAQIYEPQAQRGGEGIVIVVRARGNPALIPALIKTEVLGLDPNLPVGDVNTTADFLHVKLTVNRLTLQLLTTFAGIGLFIAIIGIYGVVAFSVSQRTLEIGIRMALGAQTKDVMRMVLRQGVSLVGLGFMVGTLATTFAGRALESLLYNTSGTDPLSLVATTLVFAAVAAFACWLPARRATKVDPIVALRVE